MNIKKYEKYPLIIREVIEKYDENESNFVQIHKLIDIFEAGLKFLTVILLMEYFGKKKVADDIKKDIFSVISRPSLGHWKMFLDKLIKALEKNKVKTIINEVSDFKKEFMNQQIIIKSKQSAKINHLINLRNYYGHGAVPDETNCKKDVEIYKPLIIDFLKKISFVQEMEIAGKKDEIYIKREKKNKKIKVYPLIMEKKGNYFYYNSEEPNKNSLYTLQYKSGEHWLTEKGYEEYKEIFNKKQKQRKILSDNEVVKEKTKFFIKRNEEIKRCLKFTQKKDSGYFVIKGEPGIGKSSLCSGLIRVIDDVNYEIESEFQEMAIEESLEAQIKGKIDVIAYFIRRDYNDNLGVYAIYNNLKKQISNKYSQAKKECEKNKDESIKTKLKDLLRLTSEELNSKNKKLIIIIDGIDEIIDSDIENIKNMLKLGILPENIYLYLSSRKGIIEDLYNSFDPIITEEMELQGLNKEAIRAILYEVMNKYEIKEEYVENILEKSEGNPLYLKMLSDAIKYNGMKINEIEILPDGVKEFYKKILKRYDQKKNGTIIVDILIVLSISYEALNYKMLSEILNIHISKIRKELINISEVLERDELGRWKLFHLSLEEYIKEDKDGYKDVIDKCKEKMADYLIKELDGGRNVSDYTYKYIIKHLKDLNRVKDIYKYLTKELLVKKYEITNSINAVEEDISIGLKIAIIDKNKEETVRIYSIYSEIITKIKVNIIDEIFAYLKEENYKKIDESIKKISSDKSRFILFLLLMYKLVILDKNKSKIKYFSNKIKKMPLNNFELYKYQYLIHIITELYLKEAKIFEIILPKINCNKECMKYMLENIGIEKNEIKMYNLSLSLLEYNKKLSADNRNIEELILLVETFYKLKKESKVVEIENEIVKIIENVKDIEEKMEMLLKLSDLYKRIGQKEKSIKTLRDIITVIDNVNYNLLEDTESLETSSLLKVLGYYAKVAMIGSKIRTLLKNRKKGKSIKTIQNIITIIDNMDYKLLEDSELLKMSSLLGILGYYTRAVMIANRIEAFACKSEALLDISESLYKNGEKEKAMELRQEGIKIAEEFLFYDPSDYESSDEDLIEYYEQLEKESKLDYREWIENSIKKSEEKGCEVNIISIIILLLAREGDFNRSLKFLGIEDPIFREKDLQRMLKIMMENVGYNVALKIIGNLPNNDIKIISLSEISKALLKDGKRKRSIKIAETVMKMSEKLYDRTALLNISKVLYKNGEKEKAMEIIDKLMESFKNPDEFDYLLKIIETIFELGEKEKAFNTMYSIIKIRENNKNETSMAIKNSIKNIDEEYKRLLNDILISTKLNNKKAIEIIKYLYSNHRTELLSEISKVLLEKKHVNEAVNIIENIKNKDFELENLLKTSKILEEENIHEILNIIEIIKNDNDKLEDLLEISEILLERKDKEIKRKEIEEFIEISKKSIQRVSLGYGKEYYKLLEVLKILYKKDNKDKKETVIRTINHILMSISISDSEFFDDNLLLKILTVLVEMNTVNKAIEIAENIRENSYLRSKAFFQISDTLIKKKNIKEALIIMENIEILEIKVQFFLNLSQIFFENNQIDKAMNAIKKSIIIANEIEDEYYSTVRDETFERIAKFLVKHKKFRKAKEVIKYMEEESDRYKSLLLEIHLSQDIYKDSKNSQREINTLGLGIKSIEQKDQFYAFLSDRYFTEGKFDKAKYFFEKIKLNEKKLSIANSIMVNFITERKLGYKNDSNAKAIIIQCIDIIKNDYKKKLEIIGLIIEQYFYQENIKQENVLELLNLI